MQLNIHPCFYCVIFESMSSPCYSKDNQNFKSVSKGFFGEQDQFISSTLYVYMSVISQNV